MLELIEIARREELRQAADAADVAEEVLRIGGGVAGRAKPGLWSNNAVGIGIVEPAGAAEVDAIIDWYVSKGIEPRVELSPFADPAFTRALADRGFVLQSFENTFFRELVAGERVTTPFPLPDDIAISRVDPSDAATVRAYAEVVVSGFMPPGETPSEEMLELSMKWITTGGAIAFAARTRHGAGPIVGGGSVRGSDGIASLAGLSVLPDFRRKGIQLALVAARLNHCIGLGITLATIGSRPGAPTERNGRRMGFQLAYSKAILVRPGPGLEPVIG
jgi:GNAT superfamily N-acetyltransferase